MLSMSYMSVCASENLQGAYALFFSYTHTHCYMYTASSSSSSLGNAIYSLDSHLRKNSGTFVHVSTSVLNEVCTDSVIHEYNVSVRV